MLKFLKCFYTKKCKNVSYCFHDTNSIFIHEVACVASKYQIYCIFMFHPGCNSSCFKVLSLVDGKIIAMNIVDNWSVVWIIRNEWKKLLISWLVLGFLLVLFGGFSSFCVCHLPSICFEWSCSCRLHTNSYTQRIFFTHTPRQLLSLWNGSFYLEGILLVMCRRMMGVRWWRDKALFDDIPTAQ